MEIFIWRRMTCDVCQRIVLVKCILWQTSEVISKLYLETVYGDIDLKENDLWCLSTYSFSLRYTLTNIRGQFQAKLYLDTVYEDIDLKENVLWCLSTYSFGEMYTLTNIRGHFKVLPRNSVWRYWSEGEWPVMFVNVYIWFTLYFDKHQGSFQSFT